MGKNNLNENVYSIPLFGVTVDAVMFGIEDGELKILLIKRKIAPYKNSWALPGGFVKKQESLEVAILRELREETGVKKVYLEQLRTYGKPNRDPRERIVTVAYFALINLHEHSLKATSDALEARWFSLNDIPRVAFDHKEIIFDAYQRLKTKITYAAIGFELLPEKFTLSQLQDLYEIILNKKLDKRNFRKKMIDMNILEPLEEYQTNVSHRASRLYRVF